RPANLYPDFSFLPPPGDYEGRVFRLSQDYPAKPSGPDVLPAFLKVDFRKEWRRYIIEVRDYCFKDNVAGGNVEDDFQVAKSKPPYWFHMPWQHFSPMGREGVHGLTKEAPIQPQQLAVSQTASGQTYAVAFYNRSAAYTIGQTWPSKKPNLGDAQFQHGAVIFKLLFADIPTAQVPSLATPLIWRAYITETFASNTRVFKDLALIQMDIMVRDDQSPCGWVFGTFQYNGRRKGARPASWDNLVPVGLQWGNDPDITEHNVNLHPSKTIRNPKLRETIINEDDEELPPTHLGWNGRLNGPVDNSSSSCMSCHATAQMRQESELGPMFKDNAPKPGSTEWMRWFKNYKCGSRFDAHVPSADFCLQLAISAKNYQAWMGESHGIHAGNYRYLAEKARRLKKASQFTETIIESGKPVERPKQQRNF
ncbi:MAG TPA: hypothetical protein VGG64_24645, partial [Pirellulales bacterium]